MTDNEEPTSNPAVDPLAGLGDPDDEIPELAAALRAALGTEPDVRARARHRVDRTLAARSASSAITMLAGTAVATFRHLLTNPIRDADRSTEEVDL